MSDHKRVVKGTLSDFCSLAISVLSSVVYGISLVRFLGPQQYGMYSIAVNYTELFGSVAGMGIGWYLTDAVARNPAEAGRVVGLALPFQLIVLLLTTCVLVATGVWGMAYQGTVLISVCALSLGLIMNQLYNVIYCLFRAFERLELNTLIQAISKGCYVLAGTALLVTVGGVQAAVAVLVGAAVLQLALGWWWLRRLVRPIEWRLSARESAALIKRLLPFALSGFLINFRASTCIVVLGKLVSETEVGYFTGAYKVANLVTFFAIAWGNALFPLMSRCGQSHPERLRSLYHLVVRFALGFGLPVFLTLFALSDLFIQIVCGARFQPSGPLLKILAAYGAISLFSFPMGNVLVSLGRPELTTRSLGVGAVGLVCLGWLARGAGPAGAAIALVASEALVAFCYWWCARRLLGAGVRCPKTGPIIAVAGVLAVPLFLVANQPRWGQLTTLVVVMILYGAVCWKARILEEREREALAGMARNLVRRFWSRRAAAGDCV